VLSEVTCIGQPVQIYEVKLRPPPALRKQACSESTVAAAQAPGSPRRAASAAESLTSSAERLCCTEQSGLPVDYAPNDNGRSQEPVVLPSRLPSLLANGSAGTSPSDVLVDTRTISIASGAIRHTVYRLAAAGSLAGAPKLPLPSTNG